MKLLPNEEKILSSNQDKIVLTDHRIIMDDRSFGQAYFISIFLEDVSAIELKYRSEIIFIILAVLSVLAGVYLQGQGKDNALVLGMVIGLVLLVLWWVTSQRIISISTKGKTVLNFKVEGMSKDKMMEFADKVSLAKQNRITKVYKM